MLTVEDIRDPRLKSGFRGVWASKDKKSFHAQAGTARVGQSPWFGKTRRTAEEAAQDYCNYVNGTQTMLTIEDIRNPKRKSGFDHVGPAGAGNSLDPSKRMTAFRAQQGQTAALPKGWRGPNRATAEEAAQDYCDHINKQWITVATTPYDAPDIDMGGVKVHAPREAPIRQPEKKSFEGPHDHYDVLFYDKQTGVVITRKVGITAKGTSRYTADATMKGYCIAPFMRAVTYPSKAAAKAAEDLKIASVCQSKNWRRVGKEAFRPINFPQMTIHNERLT